MAANNAHNVVFILTDDQGPWAMGCTGNEDIRTPNLDRLAAERRALQQFLLHVAGLLARPRQPHDRAYTIAAWRARLVVPSHYSARRAGYNRLSRRVHLLHRHAGCKRLHVRPIRQVAPGQAPPAAAWLHRLAHLRPRLQRLQQRPAHPRRQDIHQQGLPDRHPDRQRHRLHR